MVLSIYGTEARSVPVKLTEEQEYLIDCIAYKKKAELKKFLKKHSMNLNFSSDNGTPLCLACTQGDDSIVKMLLDKGADPNYADDSGTLPLTNAAYLGFDSAVKLLIKHGADMNMRGIGGGTPLMVACIVQRTNTTKLLLQTGADVNLKGTNGTSALMLVAGDTNPNLPLLRQLLDKKPKVNDVDVEGRTALYHAVEHHNAEIAKLLMENGADPKISANNHISPFLLAQKHGYSDLIRIMEGVKTN